MLTDIVPRHRSGVYCLRSREGRIVYIGGSTRCMYNRITWHMSKLRHGAHPSSGLQSLYDQNPEDLVPGVLEYCEAENVSFREKFWSSKNETLESRPAGKYRLSEETKSKIREGRQRYLRTPESREKLSRNALAQHRAGNFGANTWRTR